ncbi:MAG: HAD family phosphatase [Muribaculaceae bacterium]|nr:HAD family phosphatase [Muribaculaceae bacterium]
MISVLFDLDGVLVDTETIYTEFWASMGREFNLSPTFASDIKGTTLGSILGFFPDEHRDYVMKRIHDFEATMPYNYFDGTLRLLKELKDNNVKTAIVTSSDDVKMNLLYKQHPELPSLINVIIDANQVTKSKPDPQGYLLAAKKLDADPSRCVVIEDSLQGLEAGRRSGAKVVGFSTTNPADVVKPLCDLCLSSIKKLNYDLLQSLFR